MSLSLHKMTPFKSSLIALAWVEYSLWARPSGRRHRETDPAMTQHLQRYYGAVGASPTEAQLRDPNWHANNFWSAAFISYLFFKAGAGTQFKYSLRHATYVSDAKVNFGKDPLQHPFQAFPIKAMFPSEGDVLVSRDRRRGSVSITWADLPRDFAGHCDLVVDASSRTHVWVIGGNVGVPGGGDQGLTVNKRKRSLDTAGFVDMAGGFAIIKNLKL